MKFYDYVVEFHGGFFGIAGVEGDGATGLYLGPGRPVCTFPCEAPIAIAMMKGVAVLLVVAAVVGMFVRRGRRARTSQAAARAGYHA